MKKTARSLLRLVLLAALLVALGISTAGAQNNLLVNPGFEPPFNAVGGDQLRRVANGWTPWNIPQGAQDPSWQNETPQYFPSSDTTNSLGVPRIRSGSDAQQYSTFFAAHQGGLFQRVTGITSGTELRFSAYIYVWSSSFDDPDVSEETTGQVVVQVGIDPNGGEDPNSASIVWSTPTQQYDAFNQYSVTARAAGQAVTVWVRSIVNFPAKNNVVYVDDASLTGTSVATSTAVPATSTPLPPATNTTVPPTNTAIVAPTFTPVPAQPTNTAIVAPTFTPMPAQPTNTAIVAPTFTPMPAQPTNTAIVAPTFTPVPAQPTNTAVPVQPTNTTVPAQPTNTVVPPPTNTLVPVNPSEFPGRVIHSVRAGDTVSRLSTLYGSTVQAIISANGLDETALIFVGQNLVIPVRLAPPATITPTATAQVIVVTATPGPTTVPPTFAPPTVPPGPGGTTVYIVQPGDTLRQIAARFNTTVTTLAQLNGITNPNFIFIGQRITVPVPGQTTPPQPPPQQTYRVQPGDNLFRIALRFGVPLSALAQANNITNPNFVFVGQLLVIP